MIIYISYWHNFYIDGLVIDNGVWNISFYQDSKDIWIKSNYIIGLMRQEM